MKKERRSYDMEFKEMAVNLCHTGKSAREVSDELGLRPELVSRWKREYNAYKEGSFSGHGNPNLSNHFLRNVNQY